MAAGGGGGMAAAGGSSKEYSVGGGAHFSITSSLSPDIFSFMDWKRHSIRASTPEIASARESNLSNNGKMSLSRTWGVRCRASRLSAAV